MLDALIIHNDVSWHVPMVQTLASSRENLQHLDDIPPSLLFNCLSKFTAVRKSGLHPSSGLDSESEAIMTETKKAAWSIIKLDIGQSLVSFHWQSK